MNPAEIPRGTRAVLGPSQCHTTVQSLERLQISHRAAVWLPPKEPHTLQQCTLFAALSPLWQQVLLFSAFCQYSHMLLPWCTNAEQHLSSSCSFYLQLQVSASQSSLCAELYPLFLPQLPLEVLALTSAFLHSEVVTRIFETMAAVVNGSLDNSREIRCHALRFSVTPCMLHTHRSTAQSMCCCTLGWSLQNCFPAHLFP